MITLSDSTPEIDRVVRWLPRIGVAALVALLGAHIAYFVAFASNGFSPKQDHWGQFGDFIGGVTNPILSFFALVALILTLLMQRRQLQLAQQQLIMSQQELAETRAEATLAREVAEEQVAHMKREARKADIYRTIQILESRLERLYREPIHLFENGKVERWELYLLFSHGTDQTLAKVPALTWEGPPEYHATILETKATLTQLHITLVKFSFLLTSLVEIDDSDDLLLFYDPTLSHLAAKLKQVGYLPPSDEETIRFKREWRSKTRQRSK